MTAPCTRPARPVIRLILGAVLLFLAPWSAHAAAADAALPRDILPLDQVRIGMKGYGLTVFEGAKIEPFAVEVISVMRDFAPHRGVVWIRCPEDRMQKTGPVAGMSGSPIYLWTDPGPHQPGIGGKLVGAFAFGFSGTKDCYAGVQSIEAMLQVGEHLKEKDGPKDPIPAGNLGRSNMPYLALRELMAAAQREPTPSGAWRAALLADVLIPKTPLSSRALGGSIPTPAGWEGQATPLLLPMAVRSASAARLLAPLLGAAGIVPLEAPPATIAGRPPQEIDVNKLELKPGSVLSIPLVFGDLDMSAQGTVTDVLPDGRVLAFGHPMFGEGRTAMPMATGFVHYVVPGLIRSFKLGGSGTIKGTILRDEGSAVAGTPGPATFSTAAVTVTVTMPDEKKRTYHYRVVNHWGLTPQLVGVVAMESLTADTGVPLESTMRIQARLDFAGHRSVQIDSVAAGAGGGGRDLAMELVAPIDLMMQNPFETVLLESMDVQVSVEPVNRAATLVEARPDRVEIAPGQTLGITARLQPFGKKAFDQRLQLALPATLAEGKYTVSVSDAASYGRTLLLNRPYLQNAANPDELLELVRTVTRISDTNLYVYLPLPDPGVAVGRVEMPLLPSSKRALIVAPTGPQTTPVTELVHDRVALDVVPQGTLGFLITVRKDLSKK